MSDLEIITEQPLNAGVRLSALDGTPLPQDRSYSRNSFLTPEPDQVTGEIEVVLPGKESAVLTLERLAVLDQTTEDMVLECAGNGRSLMTPLPSGLAWGLGGVSPIRVTGVRLADALGDLPADVVEVVFTGFDHGRVQPEGEVSYQFSIDAALARSAVPLLATGIGGEPLSHAHGGPVRLVVPGHYAMKSVKWLTRIEGLTEPFHGHFVNRYRYRGDNEFNEGEPVGPIQVRSVISHPEEGSLIPSGTTIVRGSAWSGGVGIALVELSFDGGDSWAPADLTPGDSRFAATRWRCDLALGAGRHTITARATDASGMTQPLQPRWNQLGYANNVAHQVSFEVG